MTTWVNSQFPRPDFHRQVQRHYGLQAQKSLIIPGTGAITPTQNGRPYQDAPANGHPRPSHHGEEFDGDDDGAIGHPSAHDEDLLATGAEIGD